MLSFKFSSCSRLIGFQLQASLFSCFYPLVVLLLPKIHFIMVNIIYHKKMDVCKYPALHVLDAGKTFAKQKDSLGMCVSEQHSALVCVMLLERV